MLQGFVESLFIGLGLALHGLDLGFQLGDPLLSLRLAGLDDFEFLEKRRVLNLELLIFLLRLLILGHVELVQLVDELLGLGETHL